MKFVSSYAIRPGSTSEAAKRFLEGKATPPAGLKLLGRWHKTDGSGGYSLFECESPAAMYEFAVQWSDVLEINSSAVIEDGEAGPVLARTYGK
jgi:hypothetical protein